MTKASALQAALRGSSGKAASVSQEVAPVPATSLHAPRQQTTVRPASREGKVNISGWLDPAYKRGLRMVQAITDKKLEPLLAEAPMLRRWMSRPRRCPRRREPASAPGTHVPPAHHEPTEEQRGGARHQGRRDGGHDRSTCRQPGDSRHKRSARRFPIFPKRLASAANPYGLIRCVETIEPRFAVHAGRSCRLGTVSRASLSALPAQRVEVVWAIPSALASPTFAARYVRQCAWKRW